MLASVTSAVALSLFAGACGSDGSVTTVDPATPITTTTPVVSPSEGATARAAQLAARGGIGALEASVTAPEAASISSDFAGDCGVPYEPSPEEIAESNANTEALVAVLDTYGIPYELTTDDFGFSYAQTDYRDVVAQSVVDSFWQDRFPVEAEPVEIEPLDPEELAQQAAENDALIAALDGVGADYTLHTDESGWSWVEWDYDDADANAAVDAMYAELYPPPPPSADELAAMREENGRIAAAFEAAGIAHTLVSDEAGWEWIEWDYDDASIQDEVSAIFSELYPVEPGLPCVDTLDADLPAVSGIAEPAMAESGDVAPSTAESELAPDDLELVRVDDEFTPEEVAQRDAEVAGLAEGFAAAGVDHDVWGESPWASVTFDISNDDAIGVVATVLATRG